MTAIEKTGYQKYWISDASELVWAVAVDQHHVALSFRSVSRPPIGGWGATLLERLQRVEDQAGCEPAARAEFDDPTAELLRLVHQALQHDPRIHGAIAGAGMVAYGRHAIGGPLELIRPEIWEAGTPDWPSMSLRLVDGSVIHGIRVIVLSEVDRVASPDVLPAVLADLASADPVAPPESSPNPGRGAAATQIEVNAWYRERVENWPPGSRHPSREEDEVAAKEHFGNRFHRGRTRQARKDYAPQTWKVFGRPPVSRKIGQNKSGNK